MDLIADVLIVVLVLIPGLFLGHGSEASWVSVQHCLFGASLEKYMSSMNKAVAINHSSSIQGSIYSGNKTPWRSGIALFHVEAVKNLIRYSLHILQLRPQQRKNDR
jgi:hypothetical protein